MVPADTRQGSLGNCFLSWVPHQDASISQSATLYSPPPVLAWHLISDLNILQLVTFKSLTDLVNHGDLSDARSSSQLTHSWSSSEAQMESAVVATADWISLNTSEWTLVHLSWEMGRIPWQGFWSPGRERERRDGTESNLSTPSACLQQDCENQGKYQAGMCHVVVDTSRGPAMTSLLQSEN